MDAMNRSACAGRAELVHRLREKLDEQWRLEAALGSLSDPASDLQSELRAKAATRLHDVGTELEGLRAALAEPAPWTRTLPGRSAGVASVLPAWRFALPALACAALAIAAAGRDASGRPQAAGAPAQIASAALEAAAPIAPVSSVNPYRQKLLATEEAVLRIEHQLAENRTTRQGIFEDAASAPEAVEPTATINPPAAFVALPAKALSIPFDDGSEPDLSLHIEKPESVRRHKRSEPPTETDEVGKLPAIRKQSVFRAAQF
jgi:hypothetical protein